MLNKAASLHKFRLTCNIDLGLLFLNTMINGVILPRVVREVDISIFAKWRSDFFELPTCLLSAENLNVLKLSQGIFIDVRQLFAESQGFASRSVACAYNKSVSKLLQGCTVLEELIVKRTFKDNARNFIVHVPTLKTLNIKVQFDKMSKLRSKYLTINAPNLEYLEIIDWESVIHFESVLVSLVEANVCYYGTGLFRMMEALCNAKFLHLKWTHYYDFRALRKDEAFPLFPNLTQLELNFGFDGRDLTPYFLENSHALEVLVLSKPPYTRTRNKDPESLPPQLREVYVRGFSGLHLS
ncbi:F-box/FBD/LRR-repeat protein isoform X1 [Gossypium australe]|uniref:F-box/FBD/LRR-repeat protein isoform X1 n=1 Tax=Gossypium australe TaxID=47621 RepID=A0A5B6VER1_9ROSI|nr:F-box/FBD/LRR-repeat protein isoform X1 [Gossypium australe]